MWAGTTLNINNTTGQSETAWSGGGGGPSETFPLPSFQQGVTAFGNGPLTVRSAPDLAADADPSTGLSVYDPVDYGGWVQAGGTRSAATPVTSGMIAICRRRSRTLGGIPWAAPARRWPGSFIRLMQIEAITPSDFHDITQGNNFYPAGPGYDLATGIGTPMADNLLPYLTLYKLGPAVVSSDPAQGQVVTTTTPTNFSLTFSEPIVASSIVASDFTVNGDPADSDSLSSDGKTIPAARQIHVSRCHARHGDDGAASELGARGPRWTA